MGDRKLHIGGTVPRAGWEILNVNPAACVDHVGKAEDLSRFEDHTFAEIYASHVLEHLGYQSALSAALAEWHRVLKPGGLLMVSVPDLDTLCDLFCRREELGSQQRFQLMRMMFGGQIDSFDYHYVGLNEEFLSSFLETAGFVSSERVSGFGLFQDCSEITFHGRAISLNMKALKSPLSLAEHLPVQSAPSREVIARQDPIPTTRSPQLGISSAWGGGYFTGITYESYAFQELAPSWIDYALLGQKQRPPRERDGAPFSYVELGSGMGLGLCLLAAAYPEGQFVGIDFHPSHIAYSQWLVRELGITNVRFHEADFVELADPNGRWPFDRDLQADYVVAHGILSWISPVVRTALYRLVSAILRPGGAFYCSYNTFPGWLDRSTFKALADLERRRASAADAVPALLRATHTIQRLMDPLQGASPLKVALPRLEQQLQGIAETKSVGYLCGEFAHDHWQPFYVGELHCRAADHKLSFAASASLPENHPTLLPPHAAAVIAEEADPLIRQALFDLAINQSFRRDIFVKGALPLSRTAQQQQLAEVRLRRVAPAPAEAAEAASIPTSLGTISDSAGRLPQIEAMLADQPLSLGEIHQALAIPPDDLLIFTSLLLHSGRVGLDRGDAGHAATEACRSANQRVIELMQAGHTIGFLAAPTVGHGAQPFSVLDAFVLDGLQQGLEADLLTSCVWMGMEAAGVEMRGPDGALLSDPQECLRRIDEHITSFRATTLPRLVQLGIVEQCA